MKAMSKDKDLEKILWQKIGEGAYIVGNFPGAGMDGAIQSARTGVPAPKQTSPKVILGNPSDTLEIGKNEEETKPTAPTFDFDYSGNENYLTGQKYRNRANNLTFDFDLEGNALYNQYKNYYTKQAQLGMEDAIGRASALTGGYGNSYAMSAGQQAYYGQMENLNNIIPQLYEMAYGQYRDQKSDLLRQAEHYEGLAQQDYENSLSEYELALKYLKEDDKNVEVVPIGVVNEILKVTNNDELDKLLSTYATAGIISEDKAGELYDAYKDTSYKGMLTNPWSDWKLVDMGDELNLFGIDRDVKVETPEGEELLLKELRKYLKDEGMKHGEANEAIKKLLRNLKKGKEQEQ